MARSRELDASTWVYPAEKVALADCTLPPKPSLHGYDSFVEQHTGAIQMRQRLHWEKLNQDLEVLFVVGLNRSTAATNLVALLPVEYRLIVAL